MSRPRDEDDARPAIGVPAHPRSADRPASRCRSIGRAVVRVAYVTVLEQDVATHRAPPKMLAPDPDAHSDAERIDDLLRIRRRSTRWFLAFIAAYGLGTGAAAIYSAWGVPWWGWLTVLLAVGVGAVIGMTVGKRSVPPVDDAIARLRAHRFRPPPTTERPSTGAMAVALLIGGVMVAPMAGIFHGGMQADLWALSGGIFVAAGLTVHHLGRRTGSALAALPEAQPSAGDAQTAGA